MRKLLLKSTAALAAVLCLSQGAALVHAEVSQRGNLRVSFAGKVRPTQLPRQGLAPISVSLSGTVKTTDESNPPQLRIIRLELNRHGRLQSEGLPTCHLSQIQPATSEIALANCRPALVGEGRFLADVELPDQSPFPSNGRVLAFNGRQNGKPVLYAHIYGKEPLPTSYVLPFVLRRQRSGTYATTLTATLPRIAAEWGFVEGIAITLGRRFSHGGQSRSYLSAGCPAPKGFAGATFAFARASFGFEGGKELSSVLTRRCGVRG